MYIKEKCLHDILKQNVIYSISEIGKKMTNMTISP